MSELLAATGLNGDERFNEHIDRALAEYEQIKGRFAAVAGRLFGCSPDIASWSLRQAVVWHDVGKLTDRWQRQLVEKKKTPAHAAIGAAWLYQVLKGFPLREAASFAVAIHHVDKGLVNENIERPDLRAILDGTVNDSGDIIWHESADIWVSEQQAKESSMVPQGELDLNSLALGKSHLADFTIQNLRDMAARLREWSRGCSLLEMHKRRLQAAFVHQVIKICDWRSASKRDEYEASEAVKVILEGGVLF